MTEANWHIRRIADTWQLRYSLIERILTGLGYRVNRLDHLSYKEMREMVTWPTHQIIEELVTDDA